MKALSAFVLILSFVSAIGTSAAIIPMFIFTGSIDMFIITLITFLFFIISGLLYLTLEKL